MTISLRLFVCTILTSVLLNAYQDALAASNYEEAVKETAKTLLAAAGTHRLKAVGVLDFTDLEGQVTPLGRLLAEELSTTLAETGSIRVIDRLALNQRLKQRNLTSIDLLDPSVLKAFGKSSKIEAVVTGTIVEIGSDIRINVKLIVAATAQLAAVAKSTFPKSEHAADRNEQARASAEPPTEQTRESPTPAEKVNLPPEGMMLIPAGPFLYGERDGQHRISLSSFWIDLYEVTNAHYATVRRHVYATEKADHPISNISWNAAKIFCEAIGKRLPTEQEWEKAARGTDGRRYPWAEMYDPVRVNGENRHGGTTAVGDHPDGKSPYGIYDLAGNVFEWTSSEEDEAKVYRGGSWASSPNQLRSTDRRWVAPSFRLIDLGFRCAKDGSK